MHEKLARARLYILASIDPRPIERKPNAVAYRPPNGMGGGSLIAQWWHPDGVVQLIETVTRPSGRNQRAPHSFGIFTPEFWVTFRPDEFAATSMTPPGSPFSRALFDTAKLSLTRHRTLREAQRQRARMSTPYGEATPWGSRVISYDNPRFAHDVVWPRNVALNDSAYVEVADRAKKELRRRFMDVMPNRGDVTDPTYETVATLGQIHRACSILGFDELAKPTGEFLRGYYAIPPNTTRCEQEGNVRSL